MVSNVEDPSLMKDVNAKIKILAINYNLLVVLHCATLFYTVLQKCGHAMTFPTYDCLGQDD